MAAFSNPVLGIKMFRYMSPASDCGEKIKLKLVFFRKKQQQLKPHVILMSLERNRNGEGGAHSTVHKWEKIEDHTQIKKNYFPKSQK